MSVNDLNLYLILILNTSIWNKASHIIRDYREDEYDNQHEDKQNY